MPVEIYFTNADAAIKEEEKPEVIDQEGDEATETESQKEAPKPINTTTPLWTKHPNDCTDEEYKEFYRNVFHDYK